jgi:hypothetical protein
VKLNLDTIRTEIDQYLQTAGFVVFYGFARSEEAKTVEWDVERHADYKQFLGVARQLDVKLIVLHHRHFDASLVDRALEDIENAELEYDDRRTIEARLRELSKYDGFTCALELSFDYQHTMYTFDLEAEWYSELSDLLVQLDLGFDPDAEDDDEGEPYGGYYSKN